MFYTQKPSPNSTHKRKFSLRMSMTSWIPTWGACLSLFPSFPIIIEIQMSEVMLLSNYHDSSPFSSCRFQWTFPEESVNDINVTFRLRQACCCLRRCSSYTDILLLCCCSFSAMSSFSAVKETFVGERKDVNAPNDTTLPTGVDYRIFPWGGGAKFSKKCMKSKHLVYKGEE